MYDVGGGGFGRSVENVAGTVFTYSYNIIISKYNSKSNNNNNSDSDDNKIYIIKIMLFYIYHLHYMTDNVFLLQANYEREWWYLNIFPTH